MASIIERLLIKYLKIIKSDLLSHAHVQIGVGHNTYLSGEDYIINRIIAKALGRKPVTLFDVGANVGNYSISLATTFPNADIYCFEPIPKTYQQLISNTIDYSRIKPNLKALGNLQGEIELYIGENNTDGTMASAYKVPLECIFPMVGKNITSVTAKMTTLDDFCEGKIDGIDFLKIDVEGYEYEVLKGAKKLLSNDKIKMIQFEFNEFNIASKTFMLDYYQLLPNYEFYRILPQDRIRPMGTYNSTLEIFCYQNILAVHKDLVVNLT